MYIYIVMSRALYFRNTRLVVPCTSYFRNTHQSCSCSALSIVYVPVHMVVPWALQFRSMQKVALGLGLGSAWAPFSLNNIETCIENKGRFVSGYGISLWTISKLKSNFVFYISVLISLCVHVHVYFYFNCHWWSNFMSSTVNSPNFFHISLWPSI